MGTDIHLYVEVRRDGNWVPVSPRSCGLVTWWQRETEKRVAAFDDDPTCFEDAQGHLVSGSTWFGDRNYSFFAMLAGVRNTGRGFERPYPERFRGFRPLTPSDDSFPTDLSPEVAGALERWDADAHSLRSFTMREWFSFDLNQEIRYEVMVQDEVEQPDRDEDAPLILATATEPRRHRVKIARRLCEDPFSPLPDWLRWFGHWAPRPDLEERGFVAVTNREAYLLSVPTTWWGVVSTLTTAYQDLDEVRFVFWFDN